MELKFKSWNEININTYYEIEQIRKENLDSHIGMAKLLSLLCLCDEEDILKLKILEINKLWSQATFLAEAIDVKNIKLNTIKIGDNKYKIENDLSKYSVAQFIDYNAYAKNPERCIAEILSTIIIPEGKEYNEGYDIAEVIDDIANNLDIVTAVSLFEGLKKKFQTSVSNTLESLETQMKLLEKMTTKKEKKSFLKKMKQAIKTML